MAKFIKGSYNSNIKSLIFVCTVYLFNQSLHIRNIPNPTSPQTQIIGFWEWVNDITIWPKYTIDTPITTGYTIQRKFKQDGFVELYKNCIFSDILPYHFEKFTLNAPNVVQDSVLLLVVGDWTPAFFSINNDTLTINTSHTDGPIQIFYRRK